LEHTRCVPLSKWQRVRYAYAISTREIASLPASTQCPKTWDHQRRTRRQGDPRRARWENNFPSKVRNSEIDYAIERTFRGGINQMRCTLKGGFPQELAEAPSHARHSGRPHYALRRGIPRKAANQVHGSSRSDKSLLNIKALNHAGCATVTSSF